MKTTQFISFFLFAFFVSTFTVMAQETGEEEEEEVIEIDETAIITATFVRVEAGTFVFSYVDTDGEESDIVFDKITPEAKKQVNLANASMIGKKFKVTYVTENVTDEDDEDMLVSVRIIIALEKL